MFVKSWIKCQQLPALPCMSIDAAATSDSRKKGWRKQDVKNFHPYHSVFIAHPDTMCNKIGVCFHHVCILPSSRTCIPEVSDWLQCSCWSETHPALSRWHTHEMWKSVRSICWLWLDHIFNSFLDSKPGDAAAGWYLSDFRSWKDAVMDILCLNVETRHEWGELAQPARRIAFWSRETGGFPFFTKCNRLTDLRSCCFTVTVDVWGSMCSAKFPFEISF